MNSESFLSYGRSWLPRLWRAARGFLFWGFLASALMLWSFVTLAEDVVAGDTLVFDHTVIAGVRGAASPSLTSAMRFITMLGDWRVMTTIGVIVGLRWWRQGHKSRVVILMTGALGGTALEQLLKYFFQRARPDTAGHLVNVSGYSFPSGHAMLSLCFYGVLLFLLVQGRSVYVKSLVFGLATLLLAAVGLSRIYLGVHYPSDVLGGFAAGTVWLLVNILAYQNYRNRLRRQAGSSILA